MKKLIVFAILSAFVLSCSAAKKPKLEDQKPSIATQKKTDSADEWEITVFDAEYETFVTARAQPKSMFTESSLKSRNTILVNEWNSRFYSGVNRNFYEVAIDYDSKENYGFEFEYRMYQFFAYCNWKYGIQFTGLRGSDKVK